MSDQTTTQDFVEAPASWNTRYITQDGFTCQLTLRAESGKELLERANSALTYLREQGCIPFFGYQKNGNHESKSQEEKESSNGNNPAWCPIHEVEMKRWQKEGRAWYSHKTNDGWCNGKNGKK
jgi:hypothetical protein